MIGGYILAFSAVLFGVTKGFFGKKISNFTSDLTRATYSNCLRMLICCVIGFVFATYDAGFQGFIISPAVIAISAISGLSTAVFVISWLFAVRRGAYMLVDVFLTLGVILPILLSYVCYGETVGLFDIVGLSLLIVATLILCSYNNHEKRKLRFGDYVILIVVSCANGLVGFSQKMFLHQTDTSSVSVFNFYTYVFSAAVLTVFYIYLRFHKKGSSKYEGTPIKIYAFIAIMAICLFANSYCNTLAAKTLSAAQLYPLSQGSCIILSAIMSTVFFKEKMNFKLIISLIIAFAGLCIMNLL